MKSKRERFTDRLDDVQGAQAIMMANLEDAYDYILRSFATTTRLAINAADAEIARLSAEKERLENQDHPLYDRLSLLLDKACQLEYRVAWQSKPWWKRIFS